MGAAAGYGVAQHQAAHRQAQAVRLWANQMPLIFIREGLNVTADHLRRVLRGKLPKPLEGNLKLAVEKLLLDPNALADTDDGKANATRLGAWG